MNRAAWFVPGRLEVLGKHTDYAGGRSLLAAVDRGHTVRAHASAAPSIRVHSSAADETVEVPLPGAEGADAPATGRDATPGHWSAYVRTVVDRLGANFPGRLRGAEVTIDSDLPLAAGMSSSSALIVGLSLVLMDLAGLPDGPEVRALLPDRESLAQYLATIENGRSFRTLAGERGVGTFSGSEDHTAMLCSREGCLSRYGFGPVTCEDRVALPEGLAMVVAVSGVRAEKIGPARERYNAVSAAATELLARWQALTGREDATLAQALRSTPDAAERLATAVADDDRLSRRLAQFLAESEEIIPAAAAALARGDLAAFGTLVDRSQQLAASHLGTQVPETIALAELAREEGALAASSFGAGFGGSVWALVDATDARAAAFADRWLTAYGRAFPAHAAAGLPGRAGEAPGSVHVLSLGPPAHRI